MKLTARRAHTALIAIVLLVASPFALTACSSSTGTPTATDSVSGAGAKWGACMRDAGFEVEDPDDAVLGTGVMPAPPGAAQEEYQRAGARCAKDAGVPGTSRADEQKWERQYARVADCIRENGYEDFPEQEPGGIDATDYSRGQEDGFQKVFADCMAEFSPDTSIQTVD